MTQIKEISPTELFKLTEEGGNVALVDVRSPDEFNEIHASLALNSPLDKFTAAALQKLGLTAEQPIYLICRSGARSATACRILMEAGFAHVFNVAGGTMAWKDLGLPVCKPNKKEVM